METLPLEILLLDTKNMSVLGGQQQEHALLQYTSRVFMIKQLLGWWIMLGSMWQFYVLKSLKKQLGVPEIFK